MSLRPEFSTFVRRATLHNIYCAHCGARRRFPSRFVARFRPVTPGNSTHVTSCLAPRALRFRRSRPTFSRCDARYRIPGCDAVRTGRGADLRLAGKLDSRGDACARADRAARGLAVRGSDHDRLGGFADAGNAAVGTVASLRGTAPGVSLGLELQAGPQAQTSAEARSAGRRTLRIVRGRP